MKKFIIAAVALTIAAGAAAKKQQQEVPQLTFDPSAGVERTLVMPDGQQVEYTAFENLYFVTNVEDSTYQFMNVFVPRGANEQTPILLRTYVGGYMASAAGQPQAGDATGRALQEGMVVAIPGSRGRNSTVTAAAADKKRGIKKGQTIYTGRAPAALLDLKAAIRYLRYFDEKMPGNAERIITSGTSAGGAMSALMGTTGNCREFDEMLQLMGAAPCRDDVFASICYCPIIDLDHADMAYEWLFNGTDSRQNGDAGILQVSNELKALFPDYLTSLNLTTPQGTKLTPANYMDYIKSEIIRAAQIAKDAGADIPDSLGFSFSQDAGFGAPPVNGGVTMGAPFGKMPQDGGNRRMPPMGGMKKKAGEYITDLDMDRYLNYVVSTQPLKTAPAFDTQGVEGQSASGENEEFGDASGSSVNFTAFSASRAGTTVTEQVARNVGLMNPMNFVAGDKSTVAQHWYIRHGARDRDTSFPVPVNFALRLQNAGKDVNFLLAWNRPHSGDYALNELFDWIKEITSR